MPEAKKLKMDELNRKTVQEFKQANKNPVIAVLENIRSAYNVGSVLEQPMHFLLQAVYIIGYTCRPPHKEIKKTALGAEDTVTWHYFKTTAEAIEQLKIEGYKVYAVEQVVNSLKLNHIRFSENEKVAMVFGNEVSGVEQSTISICDGCLEIPQMGMKHSLNIATAAGVVLWELTKKFVKV